MTVKIGHGFDLHRLAPGRPFWLGGLIIESAVGPVGHSDGDVVLHALCDALLGAMGLGDIGEHFPPSDPQWAGAASAQFVGHALSLMAQKGYQPSNVDITIVLEAPKLKPYKEAMRDVIATLVKLPIDCVSVKAKTMEGLGDIGQGQAVAAMVTLLAVQSPS